MLGMFRRKLMMRRWLGFSGLLVCCHALAVGCVVDNDDDDDGGKNTSAGGSGGSGATGGSGGSGGAAGDSSGGTTSSGGSAGSAGASAGGEGGEGGASVERKSALVGLEDGVFEEGDAPESSDAYDGEQISDITGPATVTNGGTFTIKVTVPSASGDMDFVVVVAGDSGHFTTTATADDGGVFSIDITLNADVDLDSLTVSVAPVDAQGDVGDYVDIDFEVIQSGTGDVKVTLAFDQDTDLDLHVIEPGGTRIYHGQRLAASGGQLDLDSNPACSIDGTNIENVFWPQGDAPAGEYIVELQYYEACVSETVNYIVTISIGDDVRTVSGSFDEDDALPFDADPGDFLREIARFEVE
jgi:hypothetical protein